VHVRVLLLGGTGEARELAAALIDDGVDVLSSLAGRVSNPALPAGKTRIGGFGGVEGLRSFLESQRFHAVVDATHPFAATITRHSATACAGLVPLLVVQRPGWRAEPGDAWSWAATIEAAAAAAAASSDGTIFLTTGRRDLAAFAADAAHHYLVRTVEPPDPPTPGDMELLLDRGPYTLDGERALLRQHDVTMLITKNSGGSMTAAKLEAARSLGVPVVVVERPPLPAGVRVVDSVTAARAWVNDLR
jgi:precorrin-6A/cobalt-precorrin-6A reductase